MSVDWLATGNDRSNSVGPTLEILLQLTATILNKRLLVNYITFRIQGIVIKINLLLNIIVSNFTFVI